MKKHPFHPRKRSEWRTTPGCLGSLAVMWALAGVSLRAQAPPPAPGSAQTTGAVLQQTEQIKAAQAARPTPPAGGAEEGEAAPETYPGESADLGPQTLLKKKKRPPLFEANADTMIMWTSNALASPWGQARDTAIFAETASLTLAPEAVELGPGKLSLRTGYRHVFWVYDLQNTAGPAQLPLNSFNFQVSSVFLNTRYNFLEKWNASLGVDYTRVMNPATALYRWRTQRLLGPISYWRESYVDITPSWSLDRSFSLGEKMSLMLSYNGAYHFTETAQGNGLDKLDSGATVSLIYLPKETLLINPSVRFTHGLYTRTQSGSEPGEHRRTTSVSPGLTVMWMPSPKVAVRAGVSADFFRSNDPDQPSYNKFDVSSGISLTIKF